ncbi:hydrolase [Clostridiaceae bacterium HSG29]|nr:hydrolase [Clostridiaceae bacterium HSG29]
MSYIPNYEEALEILKKYNKESFLILHGQIVGGVMRYFAEKYDPDNIEFWEVVGLLHDLDFGMYPDEHCVKQVEIMEELNIDESIIRATISHGYGLTKANVKPEKMMEKILFTVDELTGIIGAAGLMRPSKTISDMKVKSVRKKFKSKNFAAGCSRDVIKLGAENLGWEMDYLMEETLLAMKRLVSDLHI